MEMDHFSHEHPLTLIQSEKEIRRKYRKNSRCKGCEKLCTFPLYACTECSFYLHKSCAELPEEFQNPCHTHPLTLVFDADISFVCQACFKECNGFHFCCEVCDIDLDVDCARLIPTVEEGSKQLQHFTHFHPLVEKEDIEVNRHLKCLVCEKLCTFPLYACTECSFYLHKSCAELPEEFKNPFHTHPLTLVFDADISFVCQACFKECNGVHFCCEVCDIDLDVDCARLIPTVEEGSKQLQHFTHFHPLVEKEDIEVNRHLKCLVCGEYCLGPCYGCDPCGVFLHQPCAEFEYPAEIRRDIHPCPLALHTRVHSFRCGACDTCMLSICYHCKLCKFYIDVECALLTSIKSQDQRQIKHYSHRHPLFLDKLDDGDQVNCFVCGKDCSGRPTYVCSQLEFALHESCASVTPKIYDLLHPQHPLTLVVRTAEEYTTQEGFRCNVCCDCCNDLTYRCEPCNFNLHEQCTKLLPTIKLYEGHRHLLLYVEKIGLEAKCNACDGHCNSSLLRCPQCNFNLHLRCSPLPYTIKDSCHIDPLILKESPVEDKSDSLILKELPFDDDSDEEFYCNACEEKREPLYPIYYCPDCPFVAQLSCVISKVVEQLKGERGDVDLKTPEGKIAGKVISERQEVEKICKTEAAQAIPKWSEPEVEKVEVKHRLPFLDHLLNVFSEICQKEEAQAIRHLGVEVMPAVTSGHTSKPFTADEQKELELILFTKKMETSSAGEISFDEQDSFDISIYLDKEYKELLQKIDSSPAKDYMEFWEENEKFVHVRDYLVPESLAPILESLFAKYGDVSVDTLSPRVKMFLFVILCWTIYSMCKTKVVEISKDQLIYWWKYLKALESAGFKIKFALDHLDRVVRAYIGLRLKELVPKYRSDLDEEIKELEKKLQFLKVRQEHISEESVRKSSLTECLREATKLKWRKAGEGLQLNWLG